MVLILKDLLNFIKNNKSIFSVFVIAQIITLLGVFNAYNYYLESTAQNKSYYENMRTFSVIAPSVNEDLTSKFDKLINGEYDVQRIFVSASSEQLDISKNKKVKSKSDNPSDVKFEKLFCGDYYGTTAFKNPMFVGSYLNEQDHKTAADKIVLASSDYYNYSVGEKYIINDIEYEIVGITVEVKNYLPYETYMKNGLPVSKVNIVLKNELNQKEAAAFSDYLKKEFDGSEIQLPSGEYGSDVTNYDYLIAFSALAFSLSVINFIYIYSYILSKRKKQYAIFRIFGCSSLRGALIYTLEILLISFVSYIVTALIYSFIIYPLLHLIDRYTVFAMDIVSFLFVFVVYIFIVLIVTVPTVAKYARTKIVTQYRN